MTARIPAIGRARRVSADALSALIAEKARLESAEHTAKTILQKAEAEAAALRERAASEWQAHQDRMQDVADAQLTRFVDETRVEKGAEAMLELMRMSTQVRRDFDQMEPWLTELVITSVGKIVGAMPADEIWRGLLSSGLTSVRDRWALTLRCAPADAEVLAHLQKSHPDLMECVKEVQTDPELRPGSCLLINDNGVIDAGIETRLSTLKDVLSRFIAARSE